jgi:hypothetical protein
VVVDHEGVGKIFGRYLDNYRVESVESVEKARKLLSTGGAAALLFGSSRDLDAWHAIQHDPPPCTRLLSVPCGRPAGYRAS